MLVVVVLLYFVQLEIKLFVLVCFRFPIDLRKCQQVHTVHTIEDNCCSPLMLHSGALYVCTCNSAQ